MVSVGNGPFACCTNIADKNNSTKTTHPAGTRAVTRAVSDVLTAYLKRSMQIGGRPAVWP